MSASRYRAVLRVWFARTSQGRYATVSRILTMQLNRLKSNRPSSGLRFALGLQRHRNGASARARNGKQMLVRGQQEGGWKRGNPFPFCQPSWLSALSEVGG